MNRLPSTLERHFETRWIQLAGGIQLVPEYQFHPEREWLLDFAHPDSMVAIELHGATYTGGRHVRGKGFAEDREKMNAALSLGWQVFEITGDMLTNDPCGCIEPIVAAIEQRMEVAA